MVQLRTLCSNLRIAPQVHVFMLTDETPSITKGNKKDGQITPEVESQPLLQRKTRRRQLLKAEVKPLKMLKKCKAGPAPVIEPPDKKREGCSSSSRRSSCSS